MDVFGGIVNICSMIDLASKLIVVLSVYVSDVKDAEDTTFGSAMSSVLLATEKRNYSDQLRPNQQ